MARPRNVAPLESASLRLFVAESAVVVVEVVVDLVCEMLNADVTPMSCVAIRMVLETFMVGYGQLCMVWKEYGLISLCFCLTLLSPLSVYFLAGLPVN